MSAKLLKIACVGTLAVQAAFAIVMIVLCHQQRGYIDEGKDKYTYPSSLPGAPFWIEIAPPTLNEHVGQLNLANAILTLPLSLFVMFMALFANSNRKRWPCFFNPVYLVPAIPTIFLLSLASMIYTLVIHATSGQFDPTSLDRNQLAKQYARPFDLENWTCDMSKDVSNGNEYVNQCHLEQTRRIFVILESVMAFLTSCLAVWAFPAEKRKYDEVVEMAKIRHKPFRIDHGY